MVKLTVPYESRMEEAHVYKRETYMNLTKELIGAAYKAVAMLVEVCVREFIGSSSKDLLTKISICGKKKKEQSSFRWIWSKRNERSLHKD